MTLAFHNTCLHIHTRRLPIERGQVVKKAVLTRANTIIASSGNILRLEIAAAQKRSDMMMMQTTVNTHSHIKRSMPLLPADMFTAGFAWRCGCDAMRWLCWLVLRGQRSVGRVHSWPNTFAYMYICSILILTAGQRTMLRISANGARAPGAMQPQITISSGISVEYRSHGSWMVWRGRGGNPVAPWLCTYLSNSVVVWHRQA